MEWHSSGNRRTSATEKPSGALIDFARLAEALKRSMRIYATGLGSTFALVEPKKLGETRNVKEFSPFGDFARRVVLLSMPSTKSRKQRRATPVG